MRSTLCAAACAAAVALVIPATSYADKTVTAKTVWMFDNSQYTIDQGEKLIFDNEDSVSPGNHNVTAMTNGADGKPLFASQTIDNGAQSEVVGARQLKTGSYDFYCTIHQFMTATLKVTEKGAPLPPPGSQQNPPPQEQPQQQQSSQPSDTQAPTVRASLLKSSLRRAARTGRLGTTMNVDESATLQIALTARVRGKSITLGRATVVDGSPGRPIEFDVRLTAAGRQAVRRQKRLAVALVVQASDNAGNKSTGRARRNLRR